MKRILDTGPIVALYNRHDAFHQWAKDVLQRIKEPLWTCEAVLTEAAHLTKAPGRIAEMVKDGSVRIGLRIDEQASAIARLLGQYAPRMDFADACVVRMSELFRDSEVLTLDGKDFRIYRRNGREVIPILSPQER
jgi:predicted nucleic acid-binding protein